MSESSSKVSSDPSTLEEVGAAIKREGQHVAGEAKAAAQRMASDQRDALADYVAALADAASRGAEDLKDSGYPRSASAVSRTAEEVGGFAERLQAREPGELWDDVEDFARDHPALVFGAGFAVAFGIGRFLKSSARGDEDGSRALAGTTPPSAQVQGSDV
jgi:hypothetical protein